MLRQEVRLLLFITIIVLLLVFLLQLNVQGPDLNRQPFDGFDEHNHGRMLTSHVNFRSTGYHRSHHRGYKFDPLPISVINAVDRFLFFIGYARSGHSIVGSMLDAHPNVVIAHEYSLFAQWQAEPTLHSNRTWLFNTLYNNSRYNTYQGLRSSVSNKKGYTLHIPNWWQGAYDKTISVIGDKSGGMTAKVFRLNRRRFTSIYRQLQTSLQIPVHVIHVVRNPYDNIATMLLYNVHLKKLGIVNETNTYKNHNELDEQITSYFNQVQGVVEMVDTLQMNVMDVHSSDFIANPKAAMRKLCLGLHIDCTEEYLHACSEKVYTSESKTRHLVDWTPELRERVQQYISKYEHLKRYSWNS